MAKGKSEQAAALDLGYLLMRAGFTREEVLEVIRIKNMKTRVSEVYQTWLLARTRMRQLKDAGYHVQATDMGDYVALIIDGGKRGVPLDGIPPCFPPSMIKALGTRLLN